MAISALVMFDYDGVIVDSLQVFTDNFISACRHFAFFQVVCRADVINLFQSNVYESMTNHGLNQLTIDKILALYENLQSQQLDRLQPFDQVGDALERISRENATYLITSNVSDAARLVLAKHRITCFREILGAEQEKSKVKKIQNTMAVHRGLPAFYVGDTKGDMLEGHKAGAKTIAVTWGWHSRETLLEGNPDFVVNSPEELSGIFCL